MVCGLNGSGKTTQGKMYAGNMRICIKNQKYAERRSYNEIHLHYGDIEFGENIILQIQKNRLNTKKEKKDGNMEDKSL